MKYIGYALAYAMYGLDRAQTFLCGFVPGYDKKTIQLYAMLELRSELILRDSLQSDVSQ